MTSHLALHCFVWSNFHDVMPMWAKCSLKVILHLRNLLTHTLLFSHFLENLNFEFKNILEYTRTMFSGNT